MPLNLLLKYLLDIESIISEIELVKAKYTDFASFNDDFMAKRTIERHLEIIGEAVNKMAKINPNLRITGVKHIISLRNLIIHSYDSVDAGILWGIIQKDIPVLKKELQRLKQ